MNREEFLEELEKRLILIPKEDREDAISYYDEYIGDSGLDDGADVTALLGTPKEVAANIIGECKEKHAEQQIENKSVKGTATTLWLVILGILTLPLSVPIAIVVMVLVFVLVLVVMILVLAIGIVGAALFLGGIFLAVAAFFTVTNGLADLFTMIGFGCVGIGAGIFVLIGTAKLIKLISRGISRAASSKNRKNA